MTADSGHGLVWHRKTIRELVAGTSREGSASCTCGEWSVANLDNPAGWGATYERFISHLQREGVIA